MVLALAAVVVSGVMFYYQSAQANQSRSETMSTTMNIVATINKSFPSNGKKKSYTGLDNNFIRAVMPNLKYDNDNNIVLSNGVKISVFSNELIDNDGTLAYAYNIDLMNIPATQCSDYAASLTSVGNSLIQISVSRSGTVSGDLVFKGSPRDMRNDIITEVCGNKIAPSGSTKDDHWDFKISMFT